MNHEEAKQLLNEMLADFAFADEQCREDVINVIAANALGKAHPKLVIYGHEAGVGVGLLTMVLSHLSKDIVAPNGSTLTVGNIIVADDSLGDFIIITLRRSMSEAGTKPEGLSRWTVARLETLREAARVYGIHIAQIF